MQIYMKLKQKTWDLDYNDNSSRTSIEQKSKKHLEQLAGKEKWLERIEL